MGVAKKDIYCVHVQKKKFKIMLLWKGWMIVSDDNRKEPEKEITMDKEVNESVEENMKETQESEDIDLIELEG